MLVGQEKENVLVPFPFLFFSFNLWDGPPYQGGSASSLGHCGESADTHTQVSLRPVEWTVEMNGHEPSPSQEALQVGALGARITSMRFMEKQLPPRGAHFAQWRHLVPSSAA